MNLDRLVTFKILAETHSFSETAKKVFVTQSAVSQQIKLLQEELGPLVQKVNNQLVLTPQGRSLYEMISGPLAAIRFSVLQMEKKEIVPQYRLMGPYVFINQILIPKMATWPSIAKWQLDYGSSSQVNEALLQGGVDVGFVSSPLSEKLVHSQVVFQEKMVLAFNRQYFQQWKKSAEIKLVDMSKEMRLFSRWQEETGEDRYLGHLWAVVPGIQGIVNFVAANPCAAVVPQYLIQGNKQIVVAEVGGKTYWNNVHLCYLKKQKSKEHKDLFIRLGNLFTP
jgi:DNA-binding transcriptional LysR family regulator